MPQFVFTKSGAMQFVAVDGKELAFANGEAVKTLSAGEYRVQWFARGGEGAAFSLTVGRRHQKPPIKEKKGEIGPERKADGRMTLVV
jgi:hypothetical protein